MKYQKMINLLDNKPNQPTKFRKKNWVKVNYNSRRTYNTNTQFIFKSSMLRSTLCDYRDTYMLESLTITITGRPAEYAEKKYMKDKKE